MVVRGGHVRVGCARVQSVRCLSAFQMTFVTRSGLNLVCLPQRQLLQGL